LTLRITLQPSTGDRAVLRLEGRFTASDLAVFDASLASLAPGAREALALDLAELRWLDAAAVERVEALLRDGADVVATSPFVERLLSRAEARTSPRAGGSATDGRGSRAP